MKEIPTLKQWAYWIEPDLPHTCPKCKEKLDQIRYANDLTRKIIHLTGMIEEFEKYVAECPKCKQELAFELLDRRKIYFFQR